MRSSWKRESSIGISIPHGEIARTLEEALGIATLIGYPVVLKAQSARLPHKSDAGGVVLNVGNSQELESGWKRLHEDLAAAGLALDGVLDGVLIETMAAPGKELIVGARNDPEWGPVLLVGLGGIFAELLHDVRLLVPGLSHDEVVGEIRRLKGIALLDGFRGSAAADLPAVADVLRRLGELILRRPEIREIEINPLVAYAPGKGAIALDALIVVSESSSTA